MIMVLLIAKQSLLQHKSCTSIRLGEYFSECNSCWILYTNSSYDEYRARRDEMSRIYDEYEEMFQTPIMRRRGWLIRIKVYEVSLAFSLTTFAIQALGQGGYNPCTGSPTLTHCVCFCFPDNCK